MKREEIIQAVQASTAEVFSTMLGIEAEPGPVPAWTAPTLSTARSNGICSESPADWAGSGELSECFLCLPSLRALFNDRAEAVNKKFSMRWANSPST